MKNKNETTPGATERPAPGERGFQPGCGCCCGPEDDRCICWMHQDAPRGLRPKRCSLHEERPAHSPLPWKAEREDNGTVVLRSGEFYVAKLYPHAGPDVEDPAANAALIVAAVNERDGLLSSLAAERERSRRLAEAVRASHDDIALLATGRCPGDLVRECIDRSVARCKAVEP